MQVTSQDATLFRLRLQRHPGGQQGFLPLVGHVSVDHQRSQQDDGGHSGHQEPAEEPLFLVECGYLRLFLLRLVEHLHLREAALVVVGGVAVHQVDGLLHILACLRLLPQLGVDFRQQQIAVFVGNGGRGVGVDALQGVAECLLPVSLSHRHLAGRHVYLRGIVEHHFGAVDVGQRFFHTGFGSRHVLMARHHEDASFAG